MGLLFKYPMNECCYIFKYGTSFTLVLPILDFDLATLLGTGLLLCSALAKLLLTFTVNLLFFIPVINPGHGFTFCGYNT